MFRRELPDPLRIKVMHAEAAIVYTRFCRDSATIHQEQEQLNITGLYKVQHYRLYRLIECNFDWDAAERARSAAKLPGGGKLFNFLSGRWTLSDVALVPSDDQLTLFVNPDAFTLITHVGTDLPFDWLLTEESSGKHIDQSALGASGS